MTSASVNTVNVSIVGGPSINTAWFSGMNAQQALEGAYAQIANPAIFTYGLQYYGPQLGYLVFMINETYDSFSTSNQPYYYWEFLVNGSQASNGIDSTILNAGDAISFELVTYSTAKAVHRQAQAKRRMATA